MSSPFDDLDRPPLREASLAHGLVRPDGLWHEILVAGETGSTNADLVAAANRGAPEGTVLVAEAQTAGRGRLGRSWVAPTRSGLTFSVLLRPAPVPADLWGWLPQLLGLSAAKATYDVTDVDVRLKWPNDLLAPDGRKLGGVLAERAGDAVVIGLGLNVSTRADELPVPTATSLALAGAPVADRDTLLRAILRELADRYAGWRLAGGDAEASGLHAAYVSSCATVGQTVRVELPGGKAVTGAAVGIDPRGHLIVADEHGPQALSAGDVVHVR
jgi:BirA family biotin operon repressor/biotin-[acetyl-CoA-carboxylase] ligase